VVHIQDLLYANVSMQDYDVLTFAGGFSFGDDLGAGKVLANKIRYQKLPTGQTLWDEIALFLDNENYILGICNGFQLLVRLGLLPNTELNWEEEVSLITNESALFEDRWVTCRVNPESKSPFLKNIDKIELPVRHAEGKLILKNKKVEEAITANHLNCLIYCDANGNPAEDYPTNPNGAILSSAALTNKEGNILGMMPHPEAYLTSYNHPNWAQRKRLNFKESEKGAGLKIFSNIVEHVLEQKN